VSSSLLLFPVTPVQSVGKALATGSPRALARTAKGWPLCLCVGRRPMCQLPLIANGKRHVGHNKLCLRQNKNQQALEANLGYRADVVHIFPRHLIYIFNFRISLIR
jgi:hypothetical protein